MDYNDNYTGNPMHRPAPPCPSGIIYTVQPGDTLFFIAQRYGISLNELIAANPQIPNPDLIFPGQRICIPRRPAPPVPPPPPPCPEGFIYTVQSGDTLFLIAQRYNISLSALIAANPQITDPNLIFPGQRICVPLRPVPPVPPPPPPCPEGFIYTVQPGDTLFSIAQRFNISLSALIAANPQITDPNLIVPGQRICVPIRPVPPRPVLCQEGWPYVVQSSDTLFLIARRFGVTVEGILAINPFIVDPAVIIVGQIICIPFVRPIPTCPNGFYYMVQAGDTLTAISRTFNVPVAAILRANPQITDPNVILVGQIICIPYLLRSAESED